MVAKAGVIHTKSLKDAYYEIKIGCNAPFFLIEERYRDTVPLAKLRELFHQTVVCQRKQMSFSGPPGSDKEKVVLSSAGYGLHRTCENISHEFAATHEQGLERSTVHVSRAIA